MAALGILTGADLAAQPPELLERHFGSSADYSHRAAQGEDDRPVRADRERKSIGAERTFKADLHEDADLKAALEPVLDAVIARIEAKAAAGRTVTLKLKFSDFNQVTRARSTRSPVRTREEIGALALALLVGEPPVRLPVRLMDVTLSSLVGDRAAEDEPVLA